MNFMFHESKGFLDELSNYKLLQQRQCIMQLNKIYKTKGQFNEVMFPRRNLLTEKYKFMVSLWGNGFEH
jgi:hypothetical protein